MELLDIQYMAWDKLHEVICILICILCCKHIKLEFVWFVIKGDDTPTYLLS